MFYCDDDDLQQCWMYVVNITLKILLLFFFVNNFFNHSDMYKNVYFSLSFVRRNDNNIKVKLNNFKRQRKVVISSMYFTLDALLLVF